MLKWYAEVFKFSGKELTPKALRRLKILMFLSLPVYPLLAVRLGQFGDNVDLLLNIIYIIPAFSFFLFALTKFVNRFWSRDQYLDEWERARKHEAMAFAFQVLIYTLSAVMLFGVLGDKLGLIKDVQFPPFSLYGIGIIAGGIFIYGFYIMYAYMLFTIKPMVEDSPKRKTGITV